MPDARDTAENRFAARLAELARDDDRATLAKLRRGVGKALGFAPERDGWVIRRVPRGLRDDTLEAYCLIASLFAMYPEPGPDRSLAASFAAWHDAERLRLGKPPGERLDNIDRRFTVLLDSGREDLPGRLRHAVALLRSHEAPVGWARLLRDVLRWEHPRRYVQVRWARDYWAGGKDAGHADADRAAAEAPTTPTAS